MGKDQSRILGANLGTCARSNEFPQPGDCSRKAEEQDCGEAPRQSKICILFRANELANTDSNKALYHPTKSFPGNPFHTPR